MRSILTNAILTLLVLGCTAGRVGQREPDAGGGDFDAAGRDAARGDGGDRDASGGDGGRRDAGPPAGEMDCTDGIDDDGDMLTDCADPDCDVMLCDATAMLVCHLGRCECGTAASETSCGDGIDDDCDSMFDCADPDCDGLECGPGPVLCGGGMCPCPDGFTERTCDNSGDDDCDGLNDCADPDCLNHLCNSTGFICTGAMTCECPGAGMPELLCDGHDENCNATIDEGCPMGIGIAAAGTLGPFGAGAGAAFADPCPTGAALIGIAGHAPTTLAELQPICANMVFEEDTTTFPDHTYRVRRGAPIYGALHGGMLGTTFEDLCPDDSFAIGLVGDADMAVDSIGLTCGTFQIRRGGGFGWQINLMSSGSTPERGSSGPIGGRFTGTCPTGSVITRVDGNASTGVSQVSAQCSRVTLTIR
ncbi:MAG: hypothetical protein AB7S26_13955 [Sandaracinaceae bacterium]